MKIAKVLPVAVALGLSGLPLWAGDPPPFPEFTFKMAKPPKPGSGKRINVQIDPEEAKAARPAASKPANAPADTPAITTPVSARYGWFWDHIPPEMSEASALTLESALIRLNKPPSGAAVPRPRLQTLQDIALAQGQNILMSTIGTDVSPALVLAVIAVESGGRKDAVSSAGAEGLMQLIPATATRFGVTDSLSASDNIRGGVAYLDWLLKEFKGDAIMTLAAYNAGENAVKKHGGVPPYAETRDYVPKVLAAYDVARGLCKTRPVFVTDGCALNLAMK